MVATPTTQESHATGDEGQAQDRSVGAQAFADRRPHRIHQDASALRGRGKSPSTRGPHRAALRLRRDLSLVGRRSGRAEAGEVALTIAPIFIRGLSIEVLPPQSVA